MQLTSWTWQKPTRDQTKLLSGDIYTAPKRPTRWRGHLVKAPLIVFQPAWELGTWRLGKPCRAAPNQFLHLWAILFLLPQVFKVMITNIMIAYLFVIDQAGPSFTQSLLPSASPVRPHCDLACRHKIICQVVSARSLNISPESQIVIVPQVSQHWRDLQRCEGATRRQGQLVWFHQWHLYLFVIRVGLSFCELPPTIHLIIICTVLSDQHQPCFCCEHVSSSYICRSVWDVITQLRLQK